MAGFDVTDTAQIIGALLSVIGLLVWGAKYLIKDYFKKSEELEGLKKKNMDKIQHRLDEELKEFKVAISEIKSTIREHGLKLDRSDIRVDKLHEELTKTMRMIEEFQSNSSDKLRNMIKTEIVELTKQAALIRAKKNTQ